MCKGDALMAMEQFEEAGDSYSMALELDPSIRTSKPFKVIKISCFKVFDFDPQNSWALVRKKPNLLSPMLKKNPLCY